MKNTSNSAVTSSVKPTVPRRTPRLFKLVSLALAMVLITATGGVAAAQRAQPSEATSPDKGTGILVDRVVAVVNDEIVLHSEVMQRLAPMIPELQSIEDERERSRRRKKMKSQVLDDMINEELIVQAAEEAKLEVTAKEVQGALEEIKQQNKLDDNQLAEALRLQGYTMATYRADVRRQLLRMRAVNTLVRPKVTVTDDDVRARYDEMGRRSAAVSEVRLHHIFIAVPENPTEAQLAAAKERATEVLEKARAGEDFARLAETHSDDPATKNTGGDLGWIKRGSIATEWEVIVFSMKKGESRGPINGPRGLHVFHVADIKESARESFEKMKEQIQGELFRIEMDRQTRSWQDELRKNAHVEIKL